MTENMIRRWPPQEIEAESFRIIAEELGPAAARFDRRTFPVVQRVIHATGDFSFAENLQFQPEAISAGIAAIRAGRSVLTDVNMVAAGINKGLLGKWGGRVVCRVAEPEVAALAAAQGITRAEAAMTQGLSEEIGIVAIGNAPTALLRLLELIEAGAVVRPALVVGVPVGFVNAAESKVLLARQPWPYITALSRKGGSPVAAAIVNALLRLAGEETAGEADKAWRPAAAGEATAGHPGER